MGGIRYCRYRDNQYLSSSATDQSLASLAWWCINMAQASLTFASACSIPGRAIRLFPTCCTPVPSSHDSHMSVATLHVRDEKGGAKNGYLFNATRAAVTRSEC